ncbi:UNVERIFIED_CONTAM: hypothetical protein NY603_27020, partial [Bacteroidetes bacterium 56_B9]
PLLKTERNLKMLNISAIGVLVPAVHQKMQKVKFSMLKAAGFAGILLATVPTSSGTILEITNNLRSQ